MLLLLSNNIIVDKTNRCKPVVENKNTEADQYRRYRKKRDRERQIYGEKRETEKGEREERETERKTKQEKDKENPKTRNRKKENNNEKTRSHRGWGT